jgi:hypothetical protein
MSDNNPFGGIRHSEVEQPATDSRRTVVAVGALAVVALGAGAFFLLGGSDGEEPATAPAVSAAAPAAPVVEEVVPVAVTLPSPTT